jgi:hypothetical protein
MKIDSIVSFSFLNSFRFFFTEAGAFSMFIQLIFFVGKIKSAWGKIYG